MTPGGPGAKAGIRPEDVITAVDGPRVHNGEELIVKIRSHRPGDRLELTLERGGKERTLQVTLGSAGGYGTSGGRCRPSDRPRLPGPAGLRGPSDDCQVPDTAGPSRRRVGVAGDHEELQGVLDIGPLELVALGILAVFVFGPDKLPKLIQDVSRFIRKIREFSDSAKADIRSELGPEFKDFEFEDLNPKTFVRKQLMDDDDLGLKEIRNSFDLRKEMAEVTDAVNGRQRRRRLADRRRGRFPGARPTG